LSPIFAQVDPLQLGEVDRALRTATLYAERLGADHFKAGALERLLMQYPSHDFVIDREEASDLLRTVRAPTAEETEFLTQVEPITSDRRHQGRLIYLDEVLAAGFEPSTVARGMVSEDDADGSPSGQPLGAQSGETEAGG
jgi:hypothetical protein